MKKIILLIIFIFNINIAFSISSPDPSLQRYLDEQISKNSNKMSSNLQVQSCSDVIKLQSVLNLFKSYWFLYFRK